MKTESEPKGPVDSEGFIYAISDRNDTSASVKIGFATDIDRRLRAIGTGCPFSSILVLNSWPATKNEERLWHALFSSFRTRGEWFNVAHCLGRESQPAFRHFLRKHLDAEARSHLLVLARIGANGLNLLRGFAYGNLNISWIQFLEDHGGAVASIIQVGKESLINDLVNRADNVSPDSALRTPHSVTP